MNRKTSSALCVALAGSMWGFMGLLVRRLDAAGLSSIDICFLRSFVTMLATAALLLVTDRHAFCLRLRDLWCFVGTGVLSVVFFNYCYFKTIVLTSLSVAAVMLYTAPVLVVLMSALFFHEQLTGSKLLAAVAAFVGCAFVSGVVGGAARLSAAGILFGLGSGLGYALYSIFSRCALERGYSSAAISFYTFLFASAASFFISDRAACFSALTAAPSDTLIIVLLIFLVTLFPYLLYTRGLQGLETGTASIIASIEPVVATLVGALIYHEVLDLWSLVGIALVLASILLINAGHTPTV